MKGAGLFLGTHRLNCWQGALVAAACLISVFCAGEALVSNAQVRL